MKNFERMFFVKIANRNGWLFRNDKDRTLYKFRNMIVIADSVREAILKLRASQTITKTKLN